MHSITSLYKSFIRFSIADALSSSRLYISGFNTTTRTNDYRCVYGGRGGGGGGADQIEKSDNFRYRKCSLVFPLIMCLRLGKRGWICVEDEGKLLHSPSRYRGRKTKQKPLCYLFVRVYANLCTVTVIELIVFSHNKTIIQ